jgi:hypothetical protein
MRITANLDAALVERAKEVSGMHGMRAVLEAGLKALVARETSRMLATLGGTQPGLKPITRRRPRIAARQGS